MSHFGFIAPPYLGHLNPMQALAGALMARGHRATFFGIADTERLVDTAAFGFCPAAEQSSPPGALDRLTAHMADPRGLKLFRVMADMARLTDALCHTLPDALRARGVDALVVDQLEPAGGLVADAFGLPLVSIANALLINRDPAVPPPFTDWPYDASDRGRWRNRGGYRVADLMMGGLARTIARNAARLGLPPRRSAEDCLSRVAQISQTVPGFDFPRERPTPTLHQCGPLRPFADETDVSDLLDPAKPLVFASLGTLQGGRIAVFRTIAAACQARGLHLVIAHGGRLTEAEIASLPGRPVVRAFVPQRALLRHAALAITNGGLNTVLDALAAAVPLVVVPVAFEQGAIAARLTHRGAGLSVPLGRLTIARLDDAIGRVLGQGDYKAKATALSHEIVEAGGAARAAAIIERAIEARQAAGKGAMAA